MDILTEKLVTLLITSLRSFKSKLQSVGGVGSFSHVQIETLRFVARHDRTTMKMLADYLAIQPPSATAIVNGLVKKGELARKFEASDRRLVLLTLTPAGQKTLVSCQTFIRKHLRDFLEQLNATEKRNLIHLLEKLND